MTAFVRLFDFVRSIYFVRFSLFDFVSSISFLRFRFFDFVSSISFLRVRPIPGRQCAKLHFSRRASIDGCIHCSIYVYGCIVCGNT